MSTLNGNDDSDFFRFSLRWSRFQSDWNRFRRGGLSGVLVTAGIVSFGPLRKGLGLKALEDLPGWGTIVGDIFQGMGFSVVGMQPFVRDASARLVGRSGEGG